MSHEPILGAHAAKPARLLRPSLRRRLATSDGLFATFLRRLHRAVMSFSVPAPRFIAKPVLCGFLAVRFLYYWIMRVFVCEPLFKAYCKQYGKNLHTGVFIQWVQGKGDIIIGDNVRIGGKCSFAFAARFADHPTLMIGDGTGIGHGCSFVVGKRITIGKNCTLSGNIGVLDSNGHPTDAAARQARLPPPDEDVREVVIGDEVWIGGHSMIFPGVRIGEGSVVAARSVVRTHVPPYAVVAGNPARVLFRLRPPAPKT